MRQCADKLSLTFDESSMNELEGQGANHSAACWHNYSCRNWMTSCKYSVKLGLYWGSNAAVMKVILTVVLLVEVCLGVKKC